jgi:hypothetical protein
MVREERAHRLVDAPPPAPAAGSLPTRLGRYLWERFPPLAYGPLLLAFTAGGSAAAALAAGHGDWLDGRTLLALALVTLGFLRLRLTDDVADAAADRAGRPGRPVPRGLVSARELTVTAALAAAGEVMLAAILGGAVLVAVVAAMLVSMVTVLADRRRADWPDPVADAPPRTVVAESGDDRPDGGIVPTTSALRHSPLPELAWLGTLLAGPSSGAVTRRNRAHGSDLDPVDDAFRHSPIVPLLMAAVWFARPGAPAGWALAGIVGLAWGAGLALEVGRKTRGPAEEQPAVVTYSAAIGPGRATALATGALAVAAVGGAVWAEAVGTALWPSTLMVGIVIVVRAVTAGSARLGRMRAAIALGVLALLLWPVVVAVLRSGGFA